jgi:16S rRNA (cytidine1402-2'-O)-methyltransferase
VTDDAPASAHAAPLADRVTAVLRQLSARTLPAGLYTVATPIGNLGDITLRALVTLEQADFVYCEDTRHSRTLLQHYGITRPLRPYHEHNAEKERPRILAELAAGKSVALISDAGTPLISDPGFKLVREVAAAGHLVTSLPGASAVTTALALAGLPTDAFLFAGFLPPRMAARKARLAELANMPATLVFFEAPQRLEETLADMAEVLGARDAVVARELSKLHEEARRGALPDLLAWAREKVPRGEMVILVAPGTAAAATEAEIEARIAALLAEMSVRDAAKAAAETYAIPKGRAYEIALRVKQGLGAAADDA